jgi:4-hydroxybenzoate polyprenyltransferase
MNERASGAARLSRGSLGRPHPTRALAARLVGASRIARPQKSLLASLSTLMGAYLSSPHVAIWSSPVVTAAIVNGLVCAFGFVVNDCCDAGADAIGKRDRPIPAGLISRSSAVRLTVLLGASALLLATALGPGPALAAVLLLVVSGAYSLLSLKTIPLLGIGTVAVLSAATVAYGASVAGGLSPAVVALAACVLLNSCAMETGYTVHDLPADTLAGTRTTAAQLGPDATVRISQLFTLLSVTALYAVPLRLGIAAPPYLAAVTIAATIPTVLVAVSVGLHYDAGRVARARLALRVIRLCTIAPMLLLDR